MTASLFLLGKIVIYQFYALYFLFGAWATWYVAATPTSILVSATTWLAEDNHRGRRGQPSLYLLRVLPSCVRLAERVRSLAIVIFASHFSCCLLRSPTRRRQRGGYHGRFSIERKTSRRLDQWRDCLLLCFVAVPIALGALLTVEGTPLNLRQECLWC